MKENAILTRSYCALCGRTIAEVAVGVPGFASQTGAVCGHPVYPCGCLSEVAFQLADVPPELRCLLMTRELPEAQLIFRKFGVAGYPQTPGTPHAISQTDILRGELRQAGLELHTNHSNVGPVERLKEWSTCRYTFCKRRFELAYPQGVPNAGEDACAPGEANPAQRKAVAP